MEDIASLRAAIDRLTLKRDALDENSSAYVQLFTCLTNDIISKQALLNTMISQQGNFNMAL
jgi:hypothetical protein